MPRPLPRLDVRRAGLLAARTVGTSLALLAASAAAAQADDGIDAPSDGVAAPGPADTPGIDAPTEQQGAPPQPQDQQQPPTQEPSPRGSSPEQLSEPRQPESPQAEPSRPHDHASEHPQNSGETPEQAHQQTREPAQQPTPEPADASTDGGDSRYRQGRSDQPNQPEQREQSRDTAPQPDEQPEQSRQHSAPPAPGDPQDHPGGAPDEPTNEPANQLAHEAPPSDPGARGGPGRGVRTPRADEAATDRQIARADPSPQRQGPDARAHEQGTSSTGDPASSVPARNTAAMTAPVGEAMGPTGAVPSQTGSRVDTTDTGTADRTSGRARQQAPDLGGMRPVSPEGPHQQAPQPPQVAQPGHPGQPGQPGQPEQDDRLTTDDGPSAPASSDDFAPTTAPTPPVWWVDFVRRLHEETDRREEEHGRRREEGETRRHDRNVEREDARHEWSLAHPLSDPEDEKQRLARESERHDRAVDREDERHRREREREQERGEERERERQEKRQEPAPTRRDAGPLRWSADRSPRADDPRRPAGGDGRVTIIRLRVSTPDADLDVEAGRHGGTRHQAGADTGSRVPDRNTERPRVSPPARTTGTREETVKGHDDDHDAHENEQVDGRDDSAHDGPTQQQPPTGRGPQPAPTTPGEPEHRPGTTGSSSSEAAPLQTAPAREVPGLTRPSPTPSTPASTGGPESRSHPARSGERTSDPGDLSSLVPAPLPPRSYTPVPSAETASGQGPRVTAPAPRTGAPRRDWPSGVVRDGSRVEQERGRPADVVVVPVKGTTWAALTSIPELDMVRRSKARIVLETPLLPGDGATVQACAEGAYRAHWRAFATRLSAVSRPMPSPPIVDLGAGMNREGTPWAGDPDAYAQCWTDVARTVKAVAPKAAFQWTPALGSHPGLPGESVLAAWPRPEVVDVVGVDATADGRPWSEQVNGAYGLNYWAAFADGHGRRIAVARWGVHAGAGRDRAVNPSYIRNVHDWVAGVAAKQALAYEAYSEPRDAPKEILAAYRALF